MTDYDDTPEDAFARALHRIRTEGVEKATQAALDILYDKKGPQQARSAAVNAIYRAAGLFDKRDDDDGSDPVGELTPEQANRMLAELILKRDRLAAEIGGAAKNRGGVFD